MIVLFAPKITGDYDLPDEGNIPLDEIMGIFKGPKPDSVFYWFNQFGTPPASPSQCYGQMISHGYMLATKDGKWIGRYLTHCGCVPISKAVWSVYDFEDSPKQIWQDLSAEDKVKYKHVFREARDFTTST